MKTKLLLLCCLFLCLCALFPLFHKTVRRAVMASRRQTVIIIDAGHGGSDPGKIGIHGEKEKDVNLAIAGYLRDNLIAQDYTVYMTRDTDCDLSEEGVSNKKRSDLNHRIRLISEKQATCMISIHQNSYPDSVQHGAQTFFFENRKEDERLADFVQSALLQFDDTNTRQIKATDSYYILKHCPVPAVLVECGFLSNPQEAALLTDSDYQKQLAHTIALGVCRYLP